MELYLMQHGEARSEAEDPARPLSERGRQEVGRVARASARLGLGIGAVRHSGKLRARQTAEIVAQALQPRPVLEEASGLAPNDDPAAAVAALGGAATPCLLVGHLPHLSRLASLLLVGDPGRAVVAFRMGALVALGQEGADWRLRWILTPEMGTASGD